MYQINIYIGTSINGPGIRKGYYAAIVECITTRDPVTRQITGQEETTTFNRLTLIAATKALSILNKTCNVTIYTDCQFVKNMVESRSTDQWRREEWKKAAGGRLQNKELWQEFAEELAKHHVKFQLMQDHGYRKELKKMLEEQNGKR